MNASSSLILITGAKDFPGMNSYNMATQVTKGFKWSQMAHNVFFCSNMIFFSQEDSLLSVREWYVYTWFH